MDFRELNYVLAIEKYQNITKAADSLYVSQPTLSKFLMNLENTLGQKLFRNWMLAFLMSPFSACVAFICFRQRFPSFSRNIQTSK